MSSVISATSLDLTIQTNDGPVHALKDVNLDIQKGDYVTLIGLSGIDYNVFAGKEIKVLPRDILTRGQVAIVEGEVQTQEGHGKFVAREGNGTVNRALSSWKELTAPQPVQRTGIPATGV